MGRNTIADSEYKKSEAGFYGSFEYKTYFCKNAERETGVNILLPPEYTEEKEYPVLYIPFKYKPGTRFVYNNMDPYLAGILMQRRAGCDLVSYLTPRLFSHIGIKRPAWETDPFGNSFGAGGLFLTISELHNSGVFYLNKGKWNGRQLLSEKWIEESTKPSDTDYYGYLLWRGEYNSFRADGKYSQITMIIPVKNSVIFCCRMP